MPDRAKPSYTIAQFIAASKGLRQQTPQLARGIFHPLATNAVDDAEWAYQHLNNGRMIVRFVRVEYTAFIPEPSASSSWCRSPVNGMQEWGERYTKRQRSETGIPGIRIRYIMEYLISAIGSGT